MGTTYYFARPDNRTLFDMGKAYGGKAYGLTLNAPVDVESLARTLFAWFCESPAQNVDEARDVTERVTAWVRQFADGQPFYLVSEHHEWIDSDDYRDGGWLRVVADRFDGFETKHGRARFWREKTGGHV
jgi:hypothetical protein